MLPISGHTSGLKPSELRLLERIYRRRVDPREVVSEELAAFLCHCSHVLGRQVGVLIDRSGAIVHVVVGDMHRLYLPDLGRHRASRSRFRGLRLVHTHLKSEPLSRDDLVDLAKLRLDLVAAIGMRSDGRPGLLMAAHLLPDNPEQQLWRELPPQPVHRMNLRFDALISALEEEWARRSGPLPVDGGDRAVVVQVVLTTRHGQRGAISSEQEAEQRGAELRALCRTAGLEVLDVVRQQRAVGDPRFLLGKGKLDEVVMRAMQRDATLLVFDPDLTPAQARAISDATELKVIDRTMLILDIFAQHARSRDGKLQVELAQLKYTLPRLVEKNTMMSRLTGGIGGRGPGETKLEINRRRVRERITLLEREIAQLSRRRQERRKRRRRRELPVVAIVGYTNAGKSTLFNTLTHGSVLVADQLFATLDPTSRRLRFPDEREIILTDTVGFIRDLPADLVNAFRATLEELDEADLLLHLVDASDPACAAQKAAVERILAELGLADTPRLVVYNKIDALSPEQWQLLPTEREAVALSAHDPETVRPLLLALEQALNQVACRRSWGRRWGAATAATGLAAHAASG
ncbi:MAG: GTPase HflX [Myxococcales bacterium]|nr:GTPase HflX [Myxococcota bacterium]MDW8283144.1 GTPase HflX [Myxococcales bacterium]